MEQIIVTRPNGTTYPMASKRTATRIKTAKQTMALLGDDVVNVNIESPFPQTFGIGDKITVFGRVYKLNRLAKVKKTGMREFSYDVEFEGVQYDLIRATFDLTIDTTTNTLQDVQADSLTGDLRRFATVLISNACRVFPGKWVLGTCPDTDTKTLPFGENDNCLSVLQNLCTESNFNIEFEIEQNNGVNTINFKKAGQTFPYTFRFGKGNGIYSLDRQNVSSASIITRLKVYGSTSNITSKYRAQRLCLPGKTKAQSYIEKSGAVAKYGIIEGKKFFDDIKPTFDGSVTAVESGNVLRFIDAKMFDLNALEADGKTTKYKMAGVAPKVHFNTGNLAGYEFEVHAYDHATHAFTLVKQTDDRGDEFPSASSVAFQFANGDEYKLLDVALPESYEQAAENKLANDGETYYNQNSQPKVQYGLSVTSVFLEKMVGNGSTANIFAPGDYIPVKDTDIDVDKSVRIQSLTRNLLNEYEYTLTISDTVTTAMTNRVISDLIDLDKVITMNNLKDPARARANWRSNREVLNMVFDPEGDYYADKIKPNSIDTLALSVGAKSMQFGLIGTVFQPNYQGNKNVVRVTGGVLTHYAIDAESAVSWVLADNTTALNDDGTAYYIYAACSRSTTSGSIIFSPDQIKVEQDANYYHFWIGVLNSVDIDLEARSIALSYGFTMINGRFMKTGRIESADRTTYFDLDDSEIGGRIVFSSNGTEKTLEQLGEESLVTAQTAIDACNAASTAQDTADGKRRVFVATPCPPYDIGDLWVNGRELRRCATQRATGDSYNINDWVACVAYDNTKTVIDGGLVTSGTIQVAGSNAAILSGMTGDGTAADSVRFWAGASFENRETAPFRVLQDGTTIETKARVTGELNATSGSFENVIVKGSNRSPFTRTTGSFNTEYSDNVAVLSEGGGYINAYSLPWDTKQNGRRISLVNYMFNGTLAYGGAAITSPPGKYFYENGVSKSELTISREVIVLLGYGDDTKFLGWIVLQRINMMTSHGYGRQLNVLAQGVVTGTNSSADIKYVSFDGKAMSVTRLGEGRYRVYIPSNWFGSETDYIVMMTGLGYSYGYSAAPIKPSLVARTTSYFDVDTSDDATRNDGSFVFQITNMKDWA